MSIPDHTLLARSRWDQAFVRRSLFSRHTWKSRNEERVLKCRAASRASKLHSHIHWHFWRGLGFSFDVLLWSHAQTCSSLPRKNIYIKIPSKRFLLGRVILPLAASSLYTPENTATQPLRVEWTQNPIGPPESGLPCHVCCQEELVRRSLMITKSGNPRCDSDSQTVFGRTRECSKRRSRFANRSICDSWVGSARARARTTSRSIQMVASIATTVSFYSC